jgi:hypothetical protein
MEAVQTAARYRGLLTLPNESETGTGLTNSGFEALIWGILASTLQRYFNATGTLRAHCCGGTDGKEPFMTKSPSNN